MHQRKRPLGRAEGAREIFRMKKHPRLRGEDGLQLTFQTGEQETPPAYAGKTKPEILIGRKNTCLTMGEHTKEFSLRFVFQSKGTSVNSTH